MIITEFRQADNRDLNYSQYTDEGIKDLSAVEDYNSHNTSRLDVKGMEALLLKLILCVS